MPLDTVMNSMQHQSELSVTNLPLVSAPRGSCRATQETHLKDRRYYDWGSVCEQKGVRYEAGSHLCAEDSRRRSLGEVLNAAAVVLLDWFVNLLLAWMAGVCDSQMRGTACIWETRALFHHFQTVPVPVAYGQMCTLPASPRFLSSDVGGPTGKVMYVRSCYRRVLQVVDRDLAKERSGVVFNGAHGNGKSWCSLFVVWHLVQQGRCVVYEVAEQNSVYIIPPSGGVRREFGPATAVVSELRDDTTAVHVFYAGTQTDRRPIPSLASVIVFSSVNCKLDNYTLRRIAPIPYRYCIPSYTEAELLQISATFGVPESVVNRRCSEVGPSIGYVLKYPYDKVMQLTFQLARRLAPNTTLLGDYLAAPEKTAGDALWATAPLLTASVDEGRFTEPLNAYLFNNADWHIASPELCRIFSGQGKPGLSQALLSKEQADAEREWTIVAVWSFIVAEFRRDLHQHRSAAADLPAFLIGEALTGGSFLYGRPLVEDGQLHPLNALVSHRPLQLVAGRSTTLDAALQECAGRHDALFSFARTLPSVDYAALDFRLLYHITGAPTQPDDLNTMRTICRHVKHRYPTNPAVTLVFVVPRAVIRTTAGEDETPTGALRAWCRTQAFEFEEECTAGGALRRVRVQRRYVALPVEVQADLRKLTQ